MTTQDVPNTLGDYLGILRRCRMYLVTIIPAALLLAVYLAYALPPSVPIVRNHPARAVVDPDGAGADYGDELCGPADRAGLTTSVDDREPGDDRPEIDPYPDMPNLSLTRQGVADVADTSVERVDPITLEVLSGVQCLLHSLPECRSGAGAAGGQAHRRPVPRLQRQTRAERATETYNFLSEQAKGLERQMGDADQRIAQFKARHGDALPEVQMMRARAGRAGPA